MFKRQPDTFDIWETVPLETKTLRSTSATWIISLFISKRRTLFMVTNYRRDARWYLHEIRMAHIPLNRYPFQIVWSRNKFFKTTLIPYSLFYCPVMFYYFFVRSTKWKYKILPINVIYWLHTSKFWIYLDDSKHLTSSFKISSNKFAFRLHI